MNYNNKELLKRNFINEQKLVILSITKRCNLNCLYCRKSPWEWYDVLSQNSNLLDLPIEDWNKVKEIYEKYNVAQILLTWWEPLEYPHLSDFINFLINNWIKFSLHTNWVSNKINNIFDKIVKNNINIHMSIELFEEHQKIVRGWSKYPIELISKLVQNWINVELKITLHQLMVYKKNEIEERLNYFMNLWVKSIRVQPVWETWDNFDKSIILNESFIDFLNKFIEIKKMDKYKDFIRNSIQSLEAPIKLLNKDNISYIADNCNMDKKIIFLDTDLNIKNCKTIWHRDLDKKCSDFFDFICCWFQP